MVGILPELSNQITAGEEILLAGNQLKVNSRAHIGSRMDAGLFIVIPIFIIYLTTISRRITINYLPQLIALILLSVALFFLVHYLLHTFTENDNFVTMSEFPLTTRYYGRYGQQLVFVVHSLYFEDTMFSEYFCFFHLNPISSCQLSIRNCQLGLANFQLRFGKHPVI